MTLSPGTRLGPYEITGAIGVGGMGEVYRARDTRLGREVALKVLPAEISADPDRRSRFEQEARSASALNHPNIVTVHDVGTSDSTVYIAMELVDGRTVRELLAEGPVPVKRMLSIAAQAADGLARAHSAGIVHRDLKPENVMVTRDGFVKILDFGLAKLVAPVSEAGSELATLAAAPGTHPGVVLGTVGYMSPEQASGRPLDFRSDQFSFGAILYEMATGKRAFARDTAIETLSAIIRDEPEPIAKVNPAAPAPVRWIVETCLEKDPEDRYASSRDLVRDLKQAQEHLSELSAPATPIAARRRVRATDWFSPLLGLVALLIGADLLVRTRIFARPPLPSVLRKVTFGPGLEDEPAWSPDGKFLSYTSDERGNLDIVVLPLAGGQPLRIAESDADDAQPAWSPDGSRIAFVSARDRTGRLSIVLGQGPLTEFLLDRGGDIFVAPALGGAPAKLVEDGYSPAWSPDGKKIVFQANRDGMWDLWVVPSEGGTPTRLTRDREFDYQPSWSPDGKWIAYGSGLHLHFNVRVVSADGGPPRDVTKETSWVLRPAWSADGKTLLYSAERNGLVNLWKIPFFSAGKTGSPQRVTVGPGQDVNVSVSRDGTRIVFATVHASPDIWEWSVASGTLRQITSETTLEDYPHLSPDGKTLLVDSDRSGRMAIWTLDVNGRISTELASGNQVGHAQWSPDGKQIVFVREGRILIQPLGGLSARDTGAQGGFPSWSPDGARIAFSNPRKEAWDICVVPAGGGKIARFTSMPAHDDCPTWSPDGKQIAFQAEKEGTRHLWVVPAAGGAPRQITSGDSEESHPQWSPRNPDEILFLRDHRRLYLLSLSSGKETPIDLSRARGTALPSGSVVLDYPSWSPDGSRIYFSLSRKTGDLYVLGGD